MLLKQSSQIDMTRAEWEESRGAQPRESYAAQNTLYLERQNPHASPRNVHQHPVESKTAHIPVLLSFPLSI